MISQAEKDHWLCAITRLRFVLRCHVADAEARENVFARSFLRSMLHPLDLFEQRLSLEPISPTVQVSQSTTTAAGAVGGFKFPPDKLAGVKQKGH